MDFAPRTSHSDPELNISLLTPLQKQLRRRILEVSFERKLSHLGSCLSAVDSMAAVYEVKREQDIFVLSGGHAGIGWYVVLEHLGLMPSSALQELAIHPERNEAYGIPVSTGSLGQGLPISVGMAVADRNRSIYCLVSDGETTEGSIWESIRVMVDQNLTNLKLIVNANGWAAYTAMDIARLTESLAGFGLDVIHSDGHDFNQLKQSLTQLQIATKPSVLLAHTTVNQLPFLREQDAHYHTMTEAEYQIAMELLAD